MRKIVVSVFAFITAAALLLTAGCSKPAEVEKDANQIAADVLETYLNAFSDKDAEALADTMYCQARYDTRPREDLVEEMQGKIDAIVKNYGEDFYYVFDRENFVFGDASQQMNTLNEFLGLTDADVKVDDARLIFVELSMIDSNGAEHGPSTDTVMVYRYDGEWYFYGSVA